MLKHIISSRNIKEAIEEENIPLKFAILLLIFMGFMGFITYHIGYIGNDLIYIMFVGSMFAVSAFYLIAINMFNVYKLKARKREASKYDKQLLATNGMGGTVIALIGETCLALDKHYGTIPDNNKLYKRYRLKIETAYGDILVTEPFEQMHGKLKDRGEGYSLLGCGDPDVLSYYENTKDNVVGMHCRIYNGYDRCIVKIQDKIFDAY